MVHFLRLFVIDADRDLKGRPLPARLVVSVVFDGRAEAMLSAWVALAGDALVDIFGRCIAGPSDLDDVVPFLLAHAVHPDTYHVGTVDSTVEQIREEERCAVELRKFIDERYAHTAAPVTAQEVLDSAREFVKSRPDLPQEPRPGRMRRSWILKQADLVRSGLVVLAVPLAAAVGYSRLRSPGVRGFVRSFAGSTALAAGTAVAVVRYLEITEPDTLIGQDDAKVSDLEAYEDIITQNQFTMVAEVRDSATRRFLLRATLFLSDVFSRHLARAGQLVGVNTIHFARIHRIDGGRRFLFMSDFDGGWNRYLFDFLTVGSFAVVPNWTNLLGCPKTKLLLIPRAGVRPTVPPVHPGEADPLGHLVQRPTDAHRRRRPQACRHPRGPVRRRPRRRRRHG